MKTRMSVCLTVMLVLVAMLFSGAWGGQSLARSDQPGTSSPVTENAPFDVREVVTAAHNQMHAEGNVRVTENAHYRAEFIASGLRYLPKENGVLVGAHAFAFYLSEIRIGEQSRLMSATQPAILQANRVEYTHDQGIVEAYLGLDAGVEQLFVLKDPLPPGNLTLVGHVETRLSPQEDAAGAVSFLSEGLEVLRYGEAVAFDAAGNRLAVTAHLLPDLQPGTFNLELGVAGEWLASAVYPVTIDPFIGNDFAISAATGDQFGPDLAYNDDNDQWLVVWYDSRNGVNYGIYGQRVDRNGALVGSLITIWDDADTLRFPTVAYDTTQHRYFVVWQNETHPAIEGRVINANGTFYSSNKISVTTVSYPRDPDVAYNPITDEYLVVWDSNQDINARKVGVDGVIDPGGTFSITSDSLTDTSPALLADPRDGRYLVVWGRDNLSDESDVVGRRLLSNGTPTGALLNISTASKDQGEPDLAFNSSNSQALVVWEDSRNSQFTIYGRLVNSDNTLGSEFLVSGDVAGNHFSPTVSYDAASGLYQVAWVTSQNSIYGRWINADASTRNTFVICDSLPYTFCEVDTHVVC